MKRPDIHSLGGQRVSKSYHSVSEKIYHLSPECLTLYLKNMSPGSVPWDQVWNN